MDEAVERLVLAVEDLQAAIQDRQKDSFQSLMEEVDSALVSLKISMSTMSVEEEEEDE